MKVVEDKSDVLVIGSGMGGVRAAIEAGRAGLKTLLVDKSILARASASIYAGSLVVRKFPEYLLKMGLDIPQGLDLEVPLDQSFRHFVADGARTGGSEYTANQRVSMTVACEMERRGDELRDFGVKDIYTQRWLGPPGLWGRNIMLPLVQYVKKIGVRTREMTMITDLIRQGEEIIGALGFDLRNGHVVVIQAKSVVVATGSHGQIYERAYAPIRMTADGFAMAYRAGATLSDMEMMGFDNWGIAEPGLPQYWIPPSIARTYGVLRNANGELFFLKYAQEHGIVGKGATLSLDDNLHRRYGRPYIELIPHLIKACQKEILEGRGDNGAVFLDLTRVPQERWHLDSKGVFTLNILRGFDLKERPLRVAPICIGDFKGGGVRIDERGRTDLKGLFAAGDVSPGSSLLYALMTGVLSGRGAVNRALELSMPRIDTQTGEWIEDRKGTLDTILHRKASEHGDPRKIKAKVKSIMWRCGGPLRHEEGLREGIEDLKEIKEELLPTISASGSLRGLREAMEAINMVTVGQMILTSSLYRTESRGYCQRVDYPQRDDKNWLKNTIITKEEGGMKLETTPVELLFIGPDEQREEGGR